MHLLGPLRGAVVGLGTTLRMALRKVIRLGEADKKQADATRNPLVKCGPGESKSQCQQGMRSGPNSPENSWKKAAMRPGSTPLMVSSIPQAVRATVPGSSLS